MIPQTADVLTIPRFCGSATDSAAYRYERTSVISNVTEHILALGCGRTSRNGTLVLPLVPPHNRGHGFSVREGVIDAPSGGAQPFYPDAGLAPTLLERGLLPDRHRFLQVHLAGEFAAEVQSRVAHQWGSIA